MKLKKLELRGAIGLLKGLGVEDYSIDFTKFDNGLIALIGKNGAGKTTIIENMHPFRTLISRDGSLVDHFALKDSYRKLEFEIDGIIYRAEIYIDGLTKKVEAYLFRNGVAINDGKATTYDAEITALLGSEDLFFNSVFSAQKSEGLAHLSASERRELFYELLNLNKYEKFCERAKSSVKILEAELSKTRGMLDVMKGQHKNAEDLQEQFSRHTKELYSVSISLMDYQVELQQEQISKEKATSLAATIKEKIAQQQNIADKIKELEQAILATEKAATEELNTIMVLERGEIFEINVSESQNIADYTAEIAEAKEELSAVDNLSRDEINALENKFIATAQNISTLQTMLSKESEVLNLRTQKEILQQKINNFAAEAVKLAGDLQKQQSNERLEMAGLLPLNTDVNDAKAAVSDLMNKKTNLLLEQEGLELTHTKELARIEEETSTISKVPCNQETGQSCPFIARAYEMLEKLPETRTLQEREKADVVLRLQQLHTDIEGAGIKYQTMLADLESKTKVITEKYERIYGQIAAQQDKLKIEEAAAKIEVASFVNVESALKELEGNKLQLATAQAELIKYKELIAEKENSYKNAIALAEVKRELLESKISRLQVLIDTEQGRVIAEKNKVIEKYKNKITVLNAETAAKVESYTKQLEDLRFDLDENLESELSEITATATKIETKISDLKIKIDTYTAKHAELKSSIEIVTKQIAENKALTFEITTKEAELKQLQKDILDYTFIVKAMDKTGIPILKLENSGKEITAIANDLLTFFQSDFRIAFDTTKLTKDKKKQREVFDINVIDDNGATELKNKSGGQQVWIETAIQLAIGLLLRSQGKNIETSFLDEKDGALDLNNALNYRAMIEEAHKRAGVHHSIIITHRKEIQNLIDQKIELTKELV